MEVWLMSISNVNAPTSSTPVSQIDFVQNQSDKLTALFEKITQEEEDSPPPKISPNEKNIIKINPYSNVIGASFTGVGSFLLFDFNATMGTLAIVGLAFAITGLVLELFTGISSIPLSKKENQLESWTQISHARAMQNKRDLRIGIILTELFSARANILSKAQHCLGKLFESSQEYREQIGTIEKSVSEILKFTQLAIDKGWVSEQEKADYKDLYLLVSELLTTLKDQAQRLDEMRKKGLDNLKGEKLGLDDQGTSQFDQEFSELNSQFQLNWKKAQQLYPIDLNYIQINDQWITRNAVVCQTEEEAKHHSKEAGELIIGGDKEISINIKELNKN